MPLGAQQRLDSIAQGSHLVLLPELAEDVAVDGILHKADVEALDAEVEVPKPEHEAVGGKEGKGLEGPRRPEPGSAASGEHPQPLGSLGLQHRRSQEHQRRSALS